MQRRVYVALVGLNPEGARACVLDEERGAVGFVRGAEFWPEGAARAFRVLDLDQAEPLDVLDVRYEPCHGVHLIALANHAGVFALYPDLLRTCRALGFARRSSGLRVAQPVQTDGPVTRCLSVGCGLVCAGDAWGRVAVWDAAARALSDPPMWVIDAHGRDGVALVHIAGRRLIGSIGSASKQVSLWRLNEDGGGVEQIFTMEESTNVFVNMQASYNEEDEGELVLLVGRSDGVVSFIIFSLEEDGPRRANVKLFANGYARFVGVSSNRQLYLFQSTEDELVVLEHCAKGKFRQVGRTRASDFRILTLSKEDDVVLDSIERRDLRDVLRIVDVDLEERNSGELEGMEMLLRLPEVLSRATRGALNHAMDKPMAFTDPLISVEPITQLQKNQGSSQGQRACCKSELTSDRNLQVWVKRRVKPPPAPRRSAPLHVSTSSSRRSSSCENSTRPKPLPTFCLGKKVASEQQHGYYLSQKDDEVLCPVERTELSLNLDRSSQRSRRAGGGVSSYLTIT